MQRAAAVMARFFDMLKAKGLSVEDYVNSIVDRPPTDELIVIERDADPDGGFNLEESPRLTPALRRARDGTAQLMCRPEYEPHVLNFLGRYTRCHKSGNEAEPDEVNEEIRKFVTERLDSPYRVEALRALWRMGRETDALAAFNYGGVPEERQLVLELAMAGGKRMNVSRAPEMLEALKKARSDDAVTWAIDEWAMKWARNMKTIVEEKFSRQPATFRPIFNALLAAPEGSRLPDVFWHEMINWARGFDGDEGFDWADVKPALEKLGNEQSSPLPARHRMLIRYHLREHGDYDHQD